MTSIPLSAPNMVQVLQRQFDSSLRMLANVIQACPEPAWSASDPGIWQHAYHALVGSAIWLHWPEPALVFPTFHHEGAGNVTPGAAPIYTKDQVQAYQQQVRAAIEEYFARLSPETLTHELELRGTRFTRADLILGQIRHVQHHVGCMHVLLRRLAGVGFDMPPWVGFGE